MPPQNQTLSLASTTADTEVEDTSTTTTSTVDEVFEDPVTDPVTSAPAPTTSTDESGGGPPTGNPLVDGLQQSMTEDEQEKEQTGRGEDGTDLGREKYEALLGKWLGGKLYTAMAPHLTLGKMQGYASQALDGAVPALKDALKGLDTGGDVDAGKLDAFAAALLEKSKAGAESWLASEEGKAAEKIAGWVDKNPFWISTIAVAAAATYVLTNQDIPELNLDKIKLGDDVSIGLGAKLGKTMDLALEKIELQIQVAAAQLSSKYERKLDQDEDAGTETLTESGSAGLTVSDTVKVTDDDGNETDKTIERLKATVDGTRTSEGEIGGDKSLKSYEVTAGLTALLGDQGDESISLTGSEKGTVTDGGTRKEQSGTLSIKDEDSDLSLSGTRKIGDDGQLDEQTVSGKLTEQLSESSALTLSGSGKTVVGDDGTEVVTTGGSVGYKDEVTTLDVSTSKTTTGGELTEQGTTGTLSTALGTGTTARAEVSNSKKKDDETGGLVETTSAGGELRSKKTTTDTDGNEVVLSDAGVSGKIEQRGDDIVLYDVKGDFMALLDQDSGTSIGGDVGVSKKDGAEEPTITGGITLQSGGTTQSTTVEKTGDVIAFKNTVEGVSDGITTNYTDKSSSDGSASTGLTVDGKGDNGVGIETSYSRETGPTVDGKPGKTTESGSTTLTYSDDDTDVSIGGGVDSDGGSELSASVEQGVGDDVTIKAGYEQIIKKEGVESGYQLSDTRRYDLGFTLDRSELDLSLNTSVGTFNGDLQSVKTSTELSTESGFTASTSIGYSRPIEDLKLSDESLLEVGASFGFKDPDRFRSYLLTYGYNSGLDQQTFGLKIEEQLKKFKLRLDSGLTYTGTADGVSDPSLMFNTGVLGAYQLGDQKDKNALLFGMDYQYDDINGSQFIPRAGVQIKGVPVTVDYNLQQKSFNVNVTVLQF